MIKKKMQKDWQILGPCQRIEKSMEPESQGNSNWFWCDQNSLQESEEFKVLGLEKLEIIGRIETIQNYSNAEIGQNT